MSVSNLKKIWASSILLVLIAFSCLYSLNEEMKLSIRGDILFPELNGNLSALRKIEIQSPETTISLYNDDGLWRLPEADNYYASFRLVDNLIEAISSSKIGREQSAQAATEWTQLKLLGDNGQSLGKIFIAKADEPGNHLIRRDNDKKSYRSTWKAQLPNDLMSWLRQPLLEVHVADIQSIDDNNITIARNDEGAAFYESGNKLPYGQSEYNRILTILDDLFYDKVLSSQEFVPEAYPDKRILKLTTFDGLVTELIFYTDYKEYWLQVRLSTTTLPSRQTNDYIKRNGFLYEDWWFRLPADIGRLLYTFKL